MSTPTTDLAPKEKAVRRSVQSVLPLAPGMTPSLTQLRGHSSIVAADVENATSSGENEWELARKDLQANIGDVRGGRRQTGLMAVGPLVVYSL